MQQWQKLLSQLSEDPATRLRLLIDPINELDTLYIRWENNQTTGLLGQGQLYLDIFEALHKINPYVLFFVQVCMRSACSAASMQQQLDAGTCNGALQCLLSTPQTCTKHL